MANQYRTTIALPHNLLALVASDPAKKLPGDIEALSVAFVFAQQFRALSPQEEQAVFTALLGVAAPKVD